MNYLQHYEDEKARIPPKFRKKASSPCNHSYKVFKKHLPSLDIKSTYRFITCCAILILKCEKCGKKKKITLRNRNIANRFKMGDKFTQKQKRVLPLFILAITTLLLD